MTTSVTMDQAHKALTLEKLQQKVRLLNISCRAHTILERGRISCIGQLVQMEEREILNIRGCGKWTLAEMQALLEKQFGLMVGMRASHPVIREFNARRLKLLMRKR